MSHSAMSTDAIAAIVTGPRRQYARAVEELPGVLDLGGVRADQQRNDMLGEVRDDGELAAVERRVAQAGVALVGRELQRDEVAVGTRDDDFCLVDDHDCSFCSCASRIAVQRAFSSRATDFGRLSRVNTPFLLPSTRATPLVVWKSAKFQICSPTTAGIRSNTRWYIAEEVDLVLLRPGPRHRRVQSRECVDAVLRHDDGLVVFVRPGPKLLFQALLCELQVAGLAVPAEVAVEADDVEEVDDAIVVGACRPLVRERHGARGVEFAGQGDKWLEVFARPLLRRCGLVGDAPHDRPMGGSCRER